MSEATTLCQPKNPQRARLSGCRRDLCCVVAAAIVALVPACGGAAADGASSAEPWGTNSVMPADLVGGACRRRQARRRLHGSGVSLPRRAHPRRRAARPGVRRQRPREPDGVGPDTPPLDQPGHLLRVLPDAGLPQPPSCLRGTEGPGIHARPRADPRGQLPGGLGRARLSNRAISGREVSRPVRASALRQHLANPAREIELREGLLQELHALVQHAAVRDDVGGVAGHEQAADLPA